ncbi:MAG: protein kinase, partial [Planctomycetes bacterium]|nr:protein kinase [Planctomycetota bacterium]
MVSPATLIDRRYQIEAKIGQGASGVVYRVYDTKQKRRVALKVLRTDVKSSDALQRIEREFHAIQSMRHPNILSVFDFEKNFFTMEYVEGEPLDTGRRRDVHEIVLLATVICRALRYIHAQSVLHGDLKPAHVIVGAHGEIKLIDFGLAEPLVPDGARPHGAPGTGSAGTSAAGTLDYMAPEIFRGRRPDLRSDLYSLGVMLYEMAAGRLPFEDEDPVRLIMKHLEAVPVSPREIRADLPRELERVILRLLAKDPSDRFASTDAVLEALTVIGGQKEILKARVEKGSRFLFEPKLVGREEETSLLDRSLREAVSGHPRVMLLSGEAGMGRTRLLSELRARSLFGPCEILTATCEAEPASAWAPFDAIIEQAVFALQRRSPARLAEGLARWGGGVLALAPDLAQQEAFREARPGRGTDARRAALDFLSLLGALSEEAPVLCVLDDAHHLDRAGAQMLVHLVEALPPGLRLMIALAADARPGDAARAFAEAKAVLDHGSLWTERVLGPLGKAAIVRLGASMMGGTDLDERFSTRLVEVARGNPLIAEQAIRSLAEQEAIFRKGGTWAVDPRALETAQWTGRLGDWLWRKVRQMVKAAPKHLEALRAAAILPEGGGFEVLLAVSRLDTTVLYYVLSDLVREGLLSESADRTRRRYALGAESLRAGLLEEVPPKRLSKMHEAAAEALEADLARGVAVPLAALAEHHAASGDPKRAIEHGLRAAEGAALRQGYRRALSQYQRVLAWCTEASDAASATTASTALGRLHYAAGDLAQAKGCFEEAAEGAVGPSRLTHLREAYEGLGRIALRRRSFEEALGHFQKFRASLSKDPHERAQETDETFRVSLWMGRVHQARQEWDEALRHFQSAASLVSQGADPARQAEVLRRIGEVHLACARLAPAQESLRLALRHAEGNAGLAFRASLSLCELYRCTGQLEE